MRTRIRRRYTSTWAQGYKRGLRDLRVFWCCCVACRDRNVKKFEANKTAHWATIPPAKLFFHARHELGAAIGRREHRGARWRWREASGCDAADHVLSGDGDDDGAHDSSGLRSGWATAAPRKMRTCNPRQSWPGSGTYGRTSRAKSPQSQVEAIMESRWAAAIGTAEQGPCSLVCSQRCR